MDRVYFFSDVHLGAHSEETEQKKISRLTSFLQQLKGKADYLYIVGDLYDFWFEYRTVVPKVNLRVLSALLQLVDAGVKIFYFTGNHDLWHKHYLAKEIGLTFFHEPQMIMHNKLKFFVAHGDGLTAGQWKLRLMKQIMANGLNQSLFRLLHPDFGISLMQAYSKYSKSSGENKFMAAYRKLAHEKIDAGLDAVIVGHAHVPCFENIKGKHFICLGDWIENFTYLELLPNSFQLRTWEG